MCLVDVERVLKRLGEFGKNAVEVKLAWCVTSDYGQRPVTLVGDL